MDTAAWARNVGQLIGDIFGAEEEEVAEWIRSLGQLIRAGLGLAFVGITAWSIAALSSEESSFAFGRAEHIGFLVVGVLGLFLLSCKSIARQPWWRSKDKLCDLLENAATNIGEAEFTKNTFLVAYECDELRDDLRRLRIPTPDEGASTETWYAYLEELLRRSNKRGMKAARTIRPQGFAEERSGDL